MRWKLSLKLMLAFGMLIHTLYAQITNGTFGVNTPFSSTCYGPIYGWTTDPAEPLQWEHNYNGGNWWVDITSCGWGTGRWIEQTVVTVPGKVYQLQYQLGCWNGQNLTDAGASVFINGGFRWEDHHINFSGSALHWGTFTHCFIATSNSTTIRFVCESDVSPFSPPGTNPANQNSTGAGVVGLDNVSLTHIGTITFSASGDCLPYYGSVDLSYTSDIAGDATWYYEGSLINTGAQSINITQAGHYTFQFITGCDTFTVDTLIDGCCKPDISSDAHCYFNPVNFSIWFPYECSDCITDLTINYGDGSTENSANQSFYQFTHQYGVPGTYQVIVCWLDTCSGATDCDTLSITLLACDPCEPEIDTAFFCLGDSTLFTIDFPQECEDCIMEMRIDYGDGAMDMAGNHLPIYNFRHVYGAPGTYNATICWYDACNHQVMCKSLVIIIQPCESEGCIINPSFTFNPCIPTNFINTSTSNFPVVSYLWKFGDGTISNQQNPVHNYATPGLYTVCLTITTAGPHGTTCQQTICQKIQVFYCEVKSMQLDPINMILYPNPSSGDFNISGLPQDVSDLSVYIYNIGGQLVYSEILSQGKATTTIRPGNLPPGIYFVKVEGSSFRQVVKLIIQ